MSQLEILTQNRDALLLAEAIGWLHDYWKCSDEQLRKQASNLTGGKRLPTGELTNHFPSLAGVSIHLMGEACSFANLLHRQTGATCNLLHNYLSRCHRTAHFDKQEPDGGTQSYPGVQISSPFGFEQSVPGNLTNQLWGLPWPMLANYSVIHRAKLIEQVSALFAQVGADTRRPINEVGLWDWGMLVGSLYKAAIAGALLGYSPGTHDLRWRLLNVRVNGLAYMLNVARLPDLLGRQQILADSLEQVRRLLEETYPVGNEVYRDENGSIYVVADLPKLLNFANAKGQTLRELILQAFEQGTLKNDNRLRVGGEITPSLDLDVNSWWGQDPDRYTKQQAGIALQNEIPPVGSVLSRAVISQPKIEAVEGYWQRHTADICTVCGLRPQGPEEKANLRKVCDVCEERRLDRSKAWATDQTAETIWIDEVSDTNGRLAFLVGQFDLTDWLNGKLVKSLVLIPPVNAKREVVKDPSFSRIRRIWKTTERFWQEVLKNTFAQLLSDDRRRLLLWLDQTPNLDPFHVYDLDLGRATLSVVWYPLQTDGKGGYLISADNLGQVARQLEAEKAIYDDPASAAIWVEDYVRERFITDSQPPVLRNPDQVANERNRNLLAERRIVRTERQDAAYSTAISILGEPRTFMALVPADRALGIVNAIRQKYQREMGKVRNRLPLRLGAIYFPRRTPLRAVLDAGRAMLQQKPLRGETLWRVLTTPVKQVGADLPDSELKKGTRQFDHWYAVNLAQNDRSFTWYVPAVMGDGCTEDKWFPYIFIETHDDSKVARRPRAFKGKRPAANGYKDCRLVHVGELEEGDKVYFTAASFDFEWLDTSGRRFEISYDEQGERYSRHTRPWLLDDLNHLEELWKVMVRLKTSQRHQVIHTIEATRETWYGADESELAKNDGVFRQFVADTLAGAEWPKDNPWSDNSQEERDNLVQAGISGELADLAELHMEILKER